MTTATLAAALYVGRQKAQTEKAIADRCGVSVREVQEAIQVARLAGLPVITGNEGVWHASSLQELVDQRERLRERARTQLRTAKGLDRAIRAWSGQASLGLVA